MSGTGLVYYRKRKRLTQAVVATRLGVDAGVMSRLEAGSMIPTSVQVDTLVEVLGVPPSYLFSKHILAEVAERSQAEAAS